jgi:phospholipid/cholesterol/gamma-HCH transport system ATP-binding protein
MSPTAATAKSPSETTDQNPQNPKDPKDPKDPSQPHPRWQIRVRDLNKTFGPQHVLRGVDLDIERGKTNIIIGGSGQGKSVLMKHLMGLLKPDSGHIYVDGVDLVPMGDVEIGKMRRKFGMVFQYAALFDSMNVVENIAFPLLERYSLSRDEVMKRVRDLLRRLDLADVAGIEQKFPAELSGGQRKRVGLARALIDRPEILLYDEPTTGLDPIATKNVDEMIRRTADQFNVTSVVISHDMASTFRIGDRISMLYGGKILVTGTPDEVLRSHHPELREFVETSGAVAMPPQDAARGAAASGPVSAPVAQTAPTLPRPAR